MYIYNVQLSKKRLAFIISHAQHSSFTQWIIISAIVVFTWLYNSQSHKGYDIRVLIFSFMSIFTDLHRKLPFPKKLVFSWGQDDRRTGGHEKTLSLLFFIILLKKFSANHRAENLNVRRCQPIKFFPEGFGVWSVSIQ